MRLWLRSEHLAASGVGIFASCNRNLIVSAGDVIVTRLGRILPAPDSNIFSGCGRCRQVSVTLTFVTAKGSCSGVSLDQH